MKSLLNVVKPILEQLKKAINDDIPVYMEGADKSFELPEFKSLVYSSLVKVCNLIII